MSARILDRIAGVPWLIHEGAFQTIVEIAAREPLDLTNLAEWKDRLSTEALATRPASPLPGARRAELRDGVAILHVAGPIFRHAGLMTELSGATAVADLAMDLQLALDDSRVQAILLDVDSPGGEVTGIPEMAAALQAARQRKPMIAHVGGGALSAGYWLAAAAGEVWVSPVANLGSLGAIVGITDTSERDARSGVRRVEFVSSQTPNKRPNPNTPDGRASFQAMADSLAAEFLGAVAQMRGMSEEALLEATRGGGIILGRAAVQAGMADRLGDFEGVMAELRARAAPSRMSSNQAAPPRNRQEAPMALSNSETNPETGAPVPEAKAEGAPPAPVETPAQPEVKAEAPSPTPAAPPAPDAAAAERARCAAIMTAATPDARALAQMAINEGWTVEAFTQAQTAAQAMAQAMAQRQGLAGFQASMPAPVAGADAPADASTLPPEERAKAEWDGNAKLRAEYGSIERYTAFLKAEQRGAIRLISKR